jgi:hypothetical protein
MSSHRKASGSCNRILKSLRTAFASRAMSLAVAIAALATFGLFSAGVASAKDYATEKCPASGRLLPDTGSETTNLVIDTECRVVGKERQIGVYVYHNVNVIAGGTLSFEDTRIDFHAESILVENGGTIKAGTVDHPIGRNPPIPDEVGARVRIYLWGPMNDIGAVCNQPYCGVPSDLWNSNTTLAMHMVPEEKNGKCVPASQIDPSYKLPGDDCFYGYDTFDATDGKNPAYFGHKVLAISYGGKVQFLGTKGATYSQNIDSDPANTGESWVRLTGVSADKKTLTLSSAVPTWRAGDHIVITTTDYLPTHNEEAVIQSLSQEGTTIQLQSALQKPHNATAYTLPANMPPSIGPRPLTGTMQASIFSQTSSRTVETRAAVGLLTRSIEILSDPDTPDTDTSEHDHFPVAKGYFGGHTVARQGFAQYQVKGVEFYQLGQGGIIGHYPVHFHMARKTSDENTPVTAAPYIRDSSIHDSMTRWITVHATQGMIVQRNVGYQSIGHGFYLEDATEVNNKIYGNLGASVIAAVQLSNGQPAPLNPRKVPGILARPGDGPQGDLMRYRSDWNHPSAFWIMNGWNDFQYNMAAGVTSCGACYWLLPGAVSGPSMYEVWDGYASQGLVVGSGMDNGGRAGLSPLQNFVGNSCVSSQLSFMTVGGTYDCLGFTDVATGDTTLVAVPNPLAPKAGADGAQVYYPQITDLRNPSKCPDGNGVDCSSGGGPDANPCTNSGTEAGEHCMVTVLDHYDTSFNYAQTGFAAVWLRAKWFLFTDGAVTDSQYGGLNFTTGGGYTRADSPYGNWMLAYRSVLIGSSQPLGTNGMPANAYASNAGPFNPVTGLTCSNATNFGYCLSTADAISMQMSPFPGQRMFSVYDGPAFQESNAYLDIYPTIMNGDGWMYRQRRVDGVPKDSSGCYLPNAGIAWKQPNGFYYPPAFHSQNLMFKNTNIRHFLVEPLFVTQSKPKVPPVINEGAIRNRYCSGNDSTGMFNNFTDVDRQTVLNDGVPDVGMAGGGDGSLTGLIATQISPPPTMKRETISVNEDPFFNAPKEEVECASDRHPTDQSGRGAPGTAKTSPYEYVTTGIIPECAIGYYTIQCKCPNGPGLCPVRYPNECGQAPNTCEQKYPANWTHQSANPNSFGVPLYREYLTDTEYNDKPQPKPFIQMMGQSTGQRSTLTLNHGRFYIDTSNDCAAQGGCKPFQPDTGVSVFEPSKTYYVYFVYGRASTYLTFDIYLGPNDETGKYTVKPVRGIFETEPYVFHDVEGSAPWLPEPTYDPSTNLLTVTVDLSKSDIVKDFSDEFEKSCQPSTYCEVKQLGGKKICGCNKATCTEEENVACSWGPKDPDCPDIGCYGFSFTMPGDWPGPPKDHVEPPPAKAFAEVDYFSLSYNGTGRPNVNFGAVDPTKWGQDKQCDYRQPK